jgi:hypothetical protein
MHCTKFKNFFLKIYIASHILSANSMKSKIIILSVVLFWGCLKEHQPQDTTCEKGYYLSAIIDGRMWDDTMCRQSYFLANVNIEHNGWSITIIGTDESPVTNFISLDFDFVPKSGGKYYFNNIGDVRPVGGLAGTYTHTINGVQDIKYSIDGYVNIDTITQAFVKGDFNFTAKGDANDTTLSKITYGNFYVYNAGGSGGIWPGP